MQKAIICNGTSLLLAVYKLVLDIVYIRYIYMMHINYGWWDGPYDADLSVAGYLAAWLACGVILIIFRVTLQKPIEEYRFSEYILFFLLLFSVIPGLAMCGAGAFPWEYRGAFCFFWLWFFLLEKGVSVQSVREWFVVRGLLPRRAKRRILFAIGAVVVVTVMFVFFYYGGGSFFLSSLYSSELYERRQQFSGISLIFPLNYVFANATAVFLFLLLFLLKNRRYDWAGLVILVGYMLYSCGAKKATLFSMLGGGLVYIFRRYLTKSRILCAVIVFAFVGMGAISAGWGEYVLTWLRRISFTTNLLSYCYYDFFQSHAPVLYHFVGAAGPNRSEIPLIIGIQYMGNFTYANNGLLGDAFMMGGIWGVILEPVLWCTYLYILDKASNDLAWWMKFGTSIFWVTVMQNSSFSTSMFSHGGVAMIVLAYLCSESTVANNSIANEIRSK